MKNFLFAASLAFLTVTLCPVTAVALTCPESSVAKIDESQRGWKLVSPNVSPGYIIKMKAGNATGNSYEPWRTPTWSYCKPHCYVGPQGEPTNPENVTNSAALIHSGSTVGTLIAKVGDGPILKIGADAQFTSEWSGPLLARMNDLKGSDEVPDYDNSGVMPITYQICK